MNLPAFKYLQARSLEEAVGLLSTYGKDGKIIAGGTDVLVKMKHRRLLPQYLIGINRINELDYIRYVDNEGLHIGALATVASLKASPLVRRYYPMLYQAAAYMAMIQIRNRATLVGNICNGSPSAETAPPLIALGAQARIIKQGGERMVPVENFFTGPSRTVVEPDEMVTEVFIPEPVKGSGGFYDKSSLRRMDVAVVGAAALIVPDDGKCSDVRIVLSAVAATPMRAKQAEDLLRGRVPDQDLIEQVALTAAEESRPITDIRGTAESRRAMVRELTKQVVQQALKAADMRPINPGGTNFRPANDKAANSGVC